MCFLYMYFIFLLLCLPNKINEIQVSIEKARFFKLFEVILVDLYRRDSKDSFE